MSPAPQDKAPKDPAQGRGEIAPEDREAFRKRAEDLGRRLESAREHGETTLGRKPRGEDGAANGAALARALRTSTELIGGIFVGSVIGWALDTLVMDQWLGKKTWPLFFVVFFLLGAAAGMLNVYRSAMQVKTGPNNPKAGPSVPDDADDA